MVKTRKPSVGRGGVPTPPGFEAHPERICHGGWKMQDTPRYQLEQMMKLTADEVAKVANDPDAPLFSRRLARSLLKENKWNVTEAMVNQVYGKPKEVVETIDTTPKSIEVQVLSPKTDGEKLAKKSAKKTTKTVDKS